MHKGRWICPGPRWIACGYAFVAFAGSPPPKLGTVDAGSARFQRCGFAAGVGSRPPPVPTRNCSFVNSLTQLNASSPPARSERSAPLARTRLVTTGLVAAGVVAVDVATKDWVLRSIGPTERKHIIGTFSLVRRFNTGAAFSVGNGNQVTAWIVTAVVCVVVVGVTRHLLRPPENSPATFDRRWWWVLGLIVGGALGNQIDRLFRGSGWNRGAVVDFIDPGFFPIFNVADSALTVGCIAAAALTLLVAQPTGSASAPPGTAGTSHSDDELSLHPPEPGTETGADTAATLENPPFVTDQVTPSEESAK